MKPSSNGEVHGDVADSVRLELRLSQNDSCRERNENRIGATLPAMAKPRRTCAFCGGLGMTKQHIFGKRLLSLLDGDLGTHIVIERNPGQQATSKKREGNIWSKQMRRVCSSCNGDWMRELEESTFELLSSLILGATTVPTFSQRELSARFAQIVTVASLAVPDGLDPISREDREYLRINKETPARWTAFLTRTDVPVNIGQFFYADVMGFTEFLPNGQPETGKSYVVTFVLGKLCVHLLTRSPTGYQGYIGAKLSRLWPLPGRDIDLALGDLLNRQGVLELAESIRKASLGEMVRRAARGARPL